MHALARLDRFTSYETSADIRDLSPLAAIRRLLNGLGSPEKDYKIVHVAGTHGKGLTATMIAAILRAEGPRTGLYTSPHVADERESVQLNGEWISPAKLDHLLGLVLNVAKDQEPRPSRFDLMTALAFLAFSEARVDVAVIEAGLGGRFDSTNATDKVLAVITPIDYDHLHVLGESLDEIVGHKLGIVRAGVPVVLGPQSAQAAEALDRGLARLPDVPVVRVTGFEIRPGKDRLEIRWPGGEVQTVACPPHFPRRAHLGCVKTALLAASVLQPAGVPRPAPATTWAHAALGVSLAGRLNVLENVFGLRRVVIDGCHSPDAMRVCAEQLAEWRIDGYTLILGLSHDKLGARLREGLRGLCDPAEEILLTPFASPRSASPSMLAGWLDEAGIAKAPRVQTVATADEALGRAGRMADRPVVVAGSLYLTREVLAVIGPSAASSLKWRVTAR